MSTFLSFLATKFLFLPIIFKNFIDAIEDLLGRLFVFDSAISMIWHQIMQSREHSCKIMKPNLLKTQSRLLIHRHNYYITLNIFNFYCVFLPMFHNKKSSFSWKNLQIFSNFSKKWKTIILPRYVKPPFNFFSKNMKKALQLFYTRSGRWTIFFNFLKKVKKHHSPEICKTPPFNLFSKVWKESWNWLILVGGNENSYYFQPFWVTQKLKQIFKFEKKNYKFFHEKLDFLLWYIGRKTQ